MNLPLHDMAQNRIWRAIIALACELTAGHRCSLCPAARPAGGNPNASGHGCSPSPATWPAPPNSLVACSVSRRVGWEG